MKPENLANGLVGIGGTTVAFLTSERVAIVAGMTTAAWMLWQLACSIYDRAKGRHKGPVSFPPK